MSKFAKFRGLLFLTLYLAFILPWIKGVEYFWEPDALTWEECRRRCVGLHGDVVSLHTKEEYNEAILFLNSKRVNEAVWTGLTLPPDRNTEEYFRWVDGSSPQWASWDDGDPNHMDSKKCVIVRMDKNQRYDTKSCENKYTCVCEGINGVINRQPHVSGFEKITGAPYDMRVPFSVLTRRSRLTCATDCMQIGKCHVFTYAADVCSLFTPTTDRFRLCSTENCDTYMRTVH